MRVGGCAIAGSRAPFRAGARPRYTIASSSNSSNRTTLGPDPSGSLSFQTKRRVYCHAQESRSPPDAPPKPYSSMTSDSEPQYKYLDPVNQLFSNFLPPKRNAAQELAHIEWQAPKAKGLSLDALAAVVRSKLETSEWFVTGEVDPTLFSDDFVFRDDSVATGGIRSYAQGVRQLFDQDTARAQIITVTPNKSRNCLVVTWRLEGRVNLPFRPTIPPYVVTTTLEINAEGLICSQLDEFGVPGWKLVAGALLGAWAGPDPAPPVEQLREAAALASQDSQG